MAIYATTDLHGQLDLYNKMKAILKPKDKVYFLGDAGDRGPDGWKLIKTIYADPQFIYIKGNHEDMLVNAIREYKKNPECKSKAYKLLKDNGGEKTFRDWWLDGEDARWAHALEDLPMHMEYQNKDGKYVLMSHAGYTPWGTPGNDRAILIPGGFDLIWNRDHFYDTWNDECLQNCIVVHGHTSIPSLANRLGDKPQNAKFGAYWYDSGHKVCIDNLSAGSGVACLLNLDTFEAIVVSTYDI